MSNFWGVQSAAYTHRGGGQLQFELLYRKFVIFTDLSNCWGVQGAPHPHGGATEGYATGQMAANIIIHRCNCTHICKNGKSILFWRAPLKRISFYL